MRLRTASRSLSGARIRGRRRAMSPDEVYEVALAALERSEAILEHVGDGIFSTDPRGRIQLWNRSAQRLIGCSARRAQGRPCSQVLGLRMDDTPLDCSDGCPLLAELEGKAPGSSIEVTRTTADGREQPLHMNVTALKDQNGEVAEYVHSIRDITALKQADEAKTMFLATASHELKTPLTVILGFTQALHEQWLDDDQRDEALRSIERRALELSRIVDRLLLTGRIESGRIQLEPTVVSLGELVPERATALAMVNSRTITCTFNGELPRVIADEEALKTVFDHLLDNAVKYSPDGGEIVVSAKHARATIEVEVADPGIGMTEEAAGRCFERFWQAESSDVRRFGGTGVGLYIVRSLVEAMGGSIGVRSMPGEGSTFTVRLQRATEAEMAKVHAPPAEPGVGKPTMIQEFMHQIGVPSGGGGGS